MIQPRPLPWGYPPRGSVTRRPRPIAEHPSSTAGGPRMSRRKLIYTILASVATLLIAMAAVAVLSLTVLLLRVRPTLPTVAQIAAFQPASATKIYSSDGQLLATLQIENRRPISLKEISPKLVDATLAVEDSRFYEHRGIDFRGIARAVYANLTSRDMGAQGASTITQQLARNVSAFHLGREKTVARKLREAMTAVRIEQVFDKDTILELYLNQIYYGSGAWGAEAAARTYFGKPAARLDLAEAALLAGLPQRPVAYSPYTNLKGARERRDVVLKRMLDTGRISIADYERARSEPIKLAGRRASHAIFRAPYFVDWVVQDLVKKYGVDRLYSGWKIVTTLDWRMQERAENSLRRGLRHGATQGALVAIDPHTGEVRAMVGGVDYQKDRFNAVTQGQRQPGSAFKPIVYAAAFDAGALSLYSTLKDEKLEIPNGSKIWTVHNFGGGYRNQDVTVLEAIADSINTIAVQAAQETGIPRIIFTAQRMGISTDLAPYLPLALGSSAVRPIELCSAYGVFAADGTRYAPVGVKTIEDTNGGFIWQDEPGRHRDSSLLNRGTIEQMNTALRYAVTNGTGGAASSVPNAFGKTGTTNDGRDAWFVGYTPELVTAVWVANPHRDSRGVVHYSVMPGATGGHVAAPIWADFMRRAVEVQKEANRLRRMPHYAIYAPQPPKPEQPIALDSGPTLYLNGPSPAQQSANGYYQEAQPEPADSDEGWIERPSAVTYGTYAPTGRVDYGSARTAGFQPAQDLSAGGRLVGPDTSRNTRGGGRRSANLVRICTESGRLATEWCPSTALMDFAGRNAPTAYCRLHHAPYGEPNN